MTDTMITLVAAAFAHWLPLHSHLVRAPCSKGIVSTPEMPGFFRVWWTRPLWVFPPQCWPAACMWCACPQRLQAQVISHSKQSSESSERVNPVQCLQYIIFAKSVLQLISPKNLFKIWIILWLLSWGFLYWNCSFSCLNNVCYCLSSLLSWLTAPWLIWKLHMATRGASKGFMISGLLSSIARLWIPAWSLKCLEVSDLM